MIYGQKSCFFLIIIEILQSNWYFCSAKQLEWTFFGFAKSNVASSRLSWLVAHPSIFRMFMKGTFDAYVLWLLVNIFQNWIVDRSTACIFTVFFFSLYFRNGSCWDSLPDELNMNGKVRRCQLDKLWWKMNQTKVFTKVVLVKSSRNYFIFYLYFTWLCASLKIQMLWKYESWFP